MKAPIGNAEHSSQSKPWIVEAWHPYAKSNDFHSAYANEWQAIEAVYELNKNTQPEGATYVFRHKDSKEFKTRYPWEPVY